MFPLAVAAIFGRRRQMAAPPGIPLLLLLVALSFLHLFSSVVADDLSSDRAALLALRTDLGGRTLSWNISSHSPCHWLGVNCSGRRVTGLRLPGASLAGSLRAGAVGKLTALSFLSLRFNAISGHLPPDLSALVHLRGLYLNGNAFTGSIPGTLFSLSNLVHINLADNNFSGGISPAFNDLTQLVTLLLEDNQLSGGIPPLNLPALVDFNVSNNNLRDAIPPKLQTMPATAFLGNHLCSRPLGPCSDEVSAAPSPDNPNTINGRSFGKKSKLPAVVIAAIAIGVAAGGLLLLVFLLVFFFRHADKNEIGMVDAAASATAAGGAKPRYSEVSLHDKPDKPEKGTSLASAVTQLAAAPARVALSAGGATGSNRKLVFLGRVQGFYDLEDLLKASAEVLGKGTTGTTYKALLEMAKVVAVKRLRDMNLPEKEFREKITMIGTMDHPNLVALQAYYYNKDEKLLVYEFVPNGSLSTLLHGNRGSGQTPLDWETRLNIALGSARGVEYIHSKDPASISHGNIKSSNILLGRSYEPRVSDSGISSLGASPSPSRAGAGYRAPEVTDIRRVSQKADVYSFGVVLLELLTGKAPSSTAALNDEGVDLPRWVQSVVQDEWTSEVFDSELLMKHQNFEEEMTQLLQLAIECVAQHPQNRPSMSEVVSRIEEIQRSSSTDGQNEGNDFDDQSSEKTSLSGYRPMV